MKKERNYAIDFVRFFFAMGFVIGHMAILFSRIPGRESMNLVFGLDTLCIFTCSAGYFMMAHFDKEMKRRKAEGDQTPPTKIALDYLASRIRTLGVWFTVGNLMGFIGICLLNKTPISKWFDAFLNHLGEFFGLMLTGFNYGSNIHGAYGTASSEYILINGPLWFVSGLFICSYFLYYLLAKDEKKTLGTIVPLTALVFYGSAYMNGVQPFWRNFFQIGFIQIDYAMIDMFCNLGIGCIMYRAVEALQGKEFSKGFAILLSCIQLFLVIFIPFRTLVPLNIPINPFSFNWGPAYLLSLINTFLLVLNRDHVTHFLNKKFLGAPGKLAMYIYCLHYGVIVLLYTIVPDLLFNHLPLFILAVYVITVLLSILADKVSKPIDRWLLSKPWFKKTT